MIMNVKFIALNIPKNEIAINPIIVTITAATGDTVIPNPAMVTIIAKVQNAPSLSYGDPNIIQCLDLQFHRVDIDDDWVQLDDGGGGWAGLDVINEEGGVVEYTTDNGIGDYTYESEATSQEVLKNLRSFYEIFKDDPMFDENTGIKELSVEYFIISAYVLIRHLRNHYVIDDKMKETIRNFIYHFHERWKTYDESTDTDMLSFSNHRQQGENDLAIRDRIVRQIFFEYLKENNVELIEKDEKRTFSELERIIIYRKGKGFCQQCLREGKPEKEAQVSWTEYQADHVFPHSKGGKTILENSELLCRYHNQSKGAKTEF